MTENRVLGLFISFLLICIAGQFSILYALTGGLLLFGYYAYKKGFNLRTILKMYLDGLFTARNILFTFLLIGILTALWRASGTLAAIICFSSWLIRPSVFYLAVFLLNCLVSCLTGTSFGTAATMGCVCASIASAMNSSVLLTGGAVLSGVYFGDRCSPVSTSALLVADLTGTDVSGNIRNMLRTSTVPFLFACLLYLLAGVSVKSKTASTELITQIAEEFHVHPVMLLPAAAVLILPLFHVSAKRSILCSILTAVPVCLLFRHVSPGTLLQSAAAGYNCPAPELAGIMSGGGVVSMTRAAAIVSISSCFSGIFRNTDLLNSFRKRINSLSRRTNPYTAVLAVSLLTGAAACNQTLSIMLTRQLCRDEELTRETEALYLENSAVITAPLLPWSIASAVPLASIGAPAECIFFAFFLYLLPLWNLVRVFRQEGAAVRI